MLSAERKVNWSRAAATSAAGTIMVPLLSTGKEISCLAFVGDHTRLGCRGQQTQP